MNLRVSTVQWPAVVYDMNGREATETAPILDALPDLEQYIFCSSAGVYLKVALPAVHVRAVMSHHLELQRLTWRTT